MGGRIRFIPNRSSHQKWMADQKTILAKFVLVSPGKYAILMRANPELPWKQTQRLYAGNVAQYYVQWLHENPLDLIKLYHKLSTSYTPKTKPRIEDLREERILSLREIRPLECVIRLSWNGKTRETIKYWARNHAEYFKRKIERDMRLFTVLFQRDDLTQEVEG